jgi:hypothetical protein
LRIGGDGVGECSQGRPSQRRRCARTLRFDVGAPARTRSGKAESSIPRARPSHAGYSLRHGCMACSLRCMRFCAAKQAPSRRIRSSAALLRALLQGRNRYSPASLPAGRWCPCQTRLTMLFRALVASGHACAGAAESELLHHDARRHACEFGACDCCVRKPRLRVLAPGLMQAHHAQAPSEGGRKRRPSSALSDSMNAASVCCPPPLLP